MLLASRDTPAGPPGQPRRHPAAWLAIGGLAAALVGPTAWGQTPAFAPPIPLPQQGDSSVGLQTRLMPVVPASATLDDATRRAEFQRLAADVSAMEAQLGLVKRVARLVAPSVVHIEARPTDEDRLRGDSQEAGSGVVLRFSGRDYILTNRHVVRRSAAADIRVLTVDGVPLRPTRVWTDKETDVAVLELDPAAVSLAGGTLAPALIGDSERLEIGENVLAFGSPFGLSHSVTRGIISAKGRYNLDLGDGDVSLQNFLQTDAPINPGNSGGPLVNLRGEVIGLNTAIASSSGGSEGIGFSIPINLAVRIAGQLVVRGQPSRGFLGVSLDRKFSLGVARQMGLQRPIGARVTLVQDGSPAKTAQLREDDVIVLFDGVRVDDDEHLINLVQLTEAGRRVDVELIREGQRMRTQVEVGSLAGDR